MIVKYQAGKQPSGTPVPVESLFDHLEAGISLNAFLEDFPTVSKEQAVALLDWTGNLLMPKTSIDYMLLLLDENLPKRLKFDFQEQEIYTVRDKVWNGIKKGRSAKIILRKQV